MHREIVFMSARVAQAWAEGVRPTYTQGDRWILRLGANSYVTLANGPNLTAEGRRLRDLGWDEPNLTMDLFQTPELRGRSEYLRLRNGAQVLGRIRRGDTWQYTARGREFYSRRVQLVVKIPTIEYGVGGRDWVLNNTFFPVSGSSLPGLVETYVGGGDVKRFVLNNLGIRRDNDGNLIVWEGSETVYILDEARDWTISEENYDPATGQSVVTLNRLLRGKPMLYGHFLYPELIMEESLQETNGRCVFVALAKRMNEEERLIEGALEEVFDELYDRKEPPWCGKHFVELGVTPAMLIRFAEKRNMGCLALHGNIAYHRSYGKKENGTLAFCWWAGHCYMYTSAEK